MFATIAKRYYLGNSKLHISSRSDLLFNPGVDSKEIRRNRMLQLAEQYGGFEKLSELTDTPASYFSSIKTRHKGRGMGSAVARRMETRLGLPRGWMDTPDPRGSRLAIIPAAPHDPGEAELLAIYRKLPSNNWLRAGLVSAARGILVVHMTGQPIDSVPLHGEPAPRVIESGDT